MEWVMRLTAVLPYPTVCSRYESIEQQQTDSSNAEPVTYDSNNMKVPVTLNAGQSQIDI